jgi:hypothetical protein
MRNDPSKERNHLEQTSKLLTMQLFRSPFFVVLVTLGLNLLFGELGFDVDINSVKEVVAYCIGGMAESG